MKSCKVSGYFIRGPKCQYRDMTWTSYKISQQVYNVQFIVEFQLSQLTK